MPRLGDFVLTPGSIIAKKPNEFGIEEIGAYSGNDIQSSLWWAEKKGKRITPGDSRTEKVKEFSNSLKRSSSERCFLGGIDSAHSILYFKKYGHNIPVRDFQYESIYYDQAPKDIESHFNLSKLGRIHQLKRKQSIIFNSKEVLDYLIDGKALIDENKIKIEVFPSG